MKNVIDLQNIGYAFDLAKLMLVQSGLKLASQLAKKMNEKELAEKIESHSLDI